MSPEQSAALTQAQQTINLIKNQALVDIFSSIEDLKAQASEYAKNFPNEGPSQELNVLYTQLDQIELRLRGITKIIPNQ